MSEEAKEKTGAAHRPCDEAFKRAAVAQWQSGVPARRVAEGPGITTESLRLWRRQFAQLLYLAGVLDLGRRRIVGWAMGEDLETDLPLDALKMALGQLQPKAGLLHRSDRCCRYASKAYREHLAAWSVDPSISRRGNCYDNAAMESFRSTLKEELVHRCGFVSRAEEVGAIFDHVETFYNRERLRSALGYLSPVEFEKQTNLN